MYYKTKYRSELEELLDEDFIVVKGEVRDLGGKTVVSILGHKEHYRTLLLKKVKCFIVRNGKPVRAISTDHLWISEDTCPLAGDARISFNHEIIFKAKVKEYQYASGKSQLGVTQYKKSYCNTTMKYQVK